MAALLKACEDPEYPAEIAIVISNRPEAQGIETARAAGIDAQVVDHKTYDGREPFEHAMTRLLEAAGVELIVNAGFALP